jgi:rhamnose utilization protein RhaD (predicted bifunctional aldolase and dehydrogenase)
VEGLEDKLYSVMSKIRAEIKAEADLSVGEFDGEKAQEVFNTLVDIFGEDSVITYEPSNASLGFAESKETMKEIALPFNPDQIVYCKPYPVYAEDKDSLETLIKEYKEKNGFLPKVIFVKDCGLYGADYSEKGSVTAAALFNDAMKIAVYARSFGGALPMNDDLTDFIVNWEAESYRSKQ